MAFVVLYLIQFAVVARSSREEQVHRVAIALMPEIAIQHSPHDSTPLDIPSSLDCPVDSGLGSKSVDETRAPIRE